MGEARPLHRHWQTPKLQQGLDGGAQRSRPSNAAPARRAGANRCPSGDSTHKSDHNQRLTPGQSLRGGDGMGRPRSRDPRPGSSPGGVIGGLHLDGGQRDRSRRARGGIGLDHRAAQLADNRMFGSTTEENALVISARARPLSCSGARPLGTARRPANMPPKLRSSGFVKSFLPPNPGLFACMANDYQQECQPARLPHGDDWVVLDSGQAKTRRQQTRRTDLPHGGNGSAAPPHCPLAQASSRHYFFAISIQFALARLRK